MNSNDISWFNIIFTLNQTTLLSVFMNILIKIEIQRPNIFHFKAFGMIHLHYEIRICQIIYNGVTMTVYVKCVVWFNVNKTLEGQGIRQNKDKTKLPFVFSNWKDIFEVHCGSSRKTCSKSQDTIVPIL